MLIIQHVVAVLLLVLAVSLLIFTVVLFIEDGIKDER